MIDQLLLGETATENWKSLGTVGRVSVATPGQLLVSSKGTPWTRPVPLQVTQLHHL